MAGAKKSTWVGGTVFIGLVIAAATWFLAISPTMSAAAELRDQAAQTTAQNDMLEVQVAKLKADFEKLPEYQAQLAALQQQIPTSAMLSDYLRQIDQIATAHAVTVTTIAPSSPLTVVVAAPVAVAATPEPEATASPEATEGADAAEGAAEGTEAAPAPAPVSGAPVGFTSIPFAITVVGSYDNTNAFLYDLQNVTRLFLVSGFTGTAQEEAAATGGKPATVVGDQELVINGFTYVLPDAFGIPAPVDPNAAPPALPGAVPGKNPLVPITGR
ncbi:hypothetical protein ASD16_06595 [Cellulomonas sp. Root485]|uniref:hypothetical protein n=1 Tax=Cellulomonas sp. Root485 TaxID=1736546 RepID=UPI0006F7B850|nr:hypothetical protein [Cellulomonas sp. Root485]KQY25104.1 hypothetical protein ASD16_06595 [Cellulomonas sp. Root485]